MSHKRDARRAFRATLLSTRPIDDAKVPPTQTCRAESTGENEYLVESPWNGAHFIGLVNLYRKGRYRVCFTQILTPEGAKDVYEPHVGFLVRPPRRHTTASGT